MGEEGNASSITLYNNNKYIPVKNFRRRTLRELNHSVYTIPEEIWGLLVVYVFVLFCPSPKQIDERVLIPFVRCLSFFFSREKNFAINVAIRKATEWCQRDLSLKFHIMASWQCDFKTKLSRDESLTIVSYVTECNFPVKKDLLPVPFPRSFQWH